MCKAKFTRLTANLLVLLSLLACNESQHTPQKSYLLVDVNALETDQSETGFPEEINRISVEAINDQEELVASSTASGNSASFNLSISFTSRIVKTLLLSWPEIGRYVGNPPDAISNLS